MKEGGVELVSLSFLRVPLQIYIHLVWNFVYLINLITPNNHKVKLDTLTSISNMAPLWIT